ncbi:hypothetical protein Prudu_019331 [Prunus dulcis]|uniref:Uncharacterized protein n=1 Tax=Prunus dulcis TaxID=3755 RepID=A0A4Y1RSR6_PRUDU|nr:hypothetical protein Prudu_019331 [Prunus dulcis]
MYCVSGINFGKCPIYRETLPKFRQKVSVFSKWARHRGMSGIPKDSSRFGKIRGGSFHYYRSIL